MNSSPIPFTTPIAIVFSVCFLNSLSGEIAEWSLEELANAPVVVSAKQASRLFDAPVNSYVFDEDAINSLPVDSIPEMLRYAPGVHVVRPTNGSWGIGIHGMNSNWFGRVPFTVDGQSVDASIFSGLSGSQHDLNFADMASVEVVYGPGGILWNNNGGNGTVNVVMKTAFETLGSYVQARIGTQNRAVETRTGWSIDEKSAARVYAKYQDRSESNFEGIGGDDWQTFRAGMRYDTRWTSEDLLSFTANVHGSDLGYSGAHPTSEEDMLTNKGLVRSNDKEELGLNLQSKWIRQFSDDEGISIQAWYAYADFSAAYASFYQNVWGVEASSRSQLANGHELVLTGGITASQIHFNNSYSVTFSDEVPFDSNAHLGVQWTKPLIEDKLELTTALSVRYETLGQTIEWSPSISLLYRPSSQDRIWLSYSRSSRPLNSLVAYGETLNNGLNAIDPFGIHAVSNLQIQWYNEDIPENEDIQTIELGYRHNFESGNEFGASAFFNRYRGLIGQSYRGYSIENAPADPYLRIQIQSDNIANADTYGLDLHYTHVLSKHWQATLAYAYLQTDYQQLSTTDSIDPFAATYNYILYSLMSEQSPQHIASILLAGQLNDNWRTDLGLRYTSSYGPSDINVEQDNILQLDARLTWTPTEQLELSLVGRNLLDSSTAENVLLDYIGDNSEQKREFYLELTYLF
ncbi:TonB-dependent receptor [Coraliomargarita algicola]|uniref:TonB-dependent receptor n=1 Tax=Coraliomargarita algicola TaxID=3092156 RepID=A0ABZ0RJ83_9BACT|nr:TonB-dependent receptor [Coraliomargarita sp. J2-16]WPJ95592.1 TonB-dependent receptor [Coraliomargarita sp. J2-16]